MHEAHDLVPPMMHPCLFSSFPENNGKGQTLSEAAKLIKAIWTSAIFLKSGPKTGEQEGPQISKPYDTAGRTKASNTDWQKPHDAEGLLTQEPKEFCTQLGMGTHSIMDQPLEYL